MSFALTAPVLGQTFSCLTTGVAPGDCSQFIHQFCGSATDLVTLIAEEDNISRCFNTPGEGFKCDFTAWNQFSSNPEVPNDTFCLETLTAITQTCPMGGQGTVSGSFFSFQLIPNEGSCSFNGN
ncbi:hypothetical protein BDP27DRAFT_1434524 [Rhodocollybia butyracea]|uniref:Glycan binding protein Y3-like domain-containing protein n=1 Tax=Rhodocollybia butyracea TaxID=206335 RepID=A0A9P5TXQ5_9AGAR|nr:hypothetical protein BDP27DRAFT_1434524 [Rhodocollybia butyracea]